MKSIENWIDHTLRFFIISLPYLLIYSITLSNALIIVLLLLALIRSFILKKFQFEWSPFFLASSLFLVPSLSLLYTSNLTIGISILETRLPLIIVPFVMSIWKPAAQLRNSFILHYIYSVIATFVVVIVIAVYRNILGPDPEMWFNKWYYNYSDLTEPINIDPLYLAILVGFGVLILLIDQFKSVSQETLFDRKYSIWIICLLCIFLSLIGARSIILITLLFVFFLLIKNIGFFSGRHSKFKAIAIITTIIGVSFLSPVTRERFEGLFISRFDFSTLTIDRFVIWKVAGTHIKDNPASYIFGNGIGSSEIVMEKLYHEQKINWDFEKKTNTHNQYLEFALDTGLMGLAFLSWFLYTSYREFKRRSDQLAIVFILFISLAMVVENYLNRQKGVVFIGIFYSLFYFITEKNLPRAKGSVTSSKLE